MAYSRFGTDTTGYTNFITTTNDLLISGDLEVNATSQFDSFVRVSNGSTRAFVVTDAGGTKQDIFIVDTTASASSSGLTVTAGPSQTAGLFILQSSGETVLSKFSDEGGFIMNISSTSAFMITHPDRATNASASFRINTLDSETKISALSTKSLGFEAYGIASVSNTLLVGPHRFDTIASVSRFFGKGGAWITGTLCVDDGETSTTDCGDATRTAGTIYSSNASVDIGDVGENFPTLDATIEAGDVVGLDYQQKNIASGTFVFESEFVRKASASNTVIGVMSKKPGLLLKGSGSKDSRSVQNVAVALAGRVPIKVSLENGPIEPGDRLTTSSIPGIAMKATKAGIVIGMALESFDGLASGSFTYLASGSFTSTSSSSTSFESGPVKIGKPLMLVNLTYWMPSIDEALADTASSSASFKNDPGAFGNIFNHEFIFRIVTEKFKNLLGIVFEKGLLKIAELITDKLTTKELCIEEVCITKDQLKALLNQNAIPASTPSPSSMPTLPIQPEQSPVVESSILDLPASSSDAGQIGTEPTLTPTPEITESPTPQATPQATPEVTPQTSENPTPTPIPEPTI